MRPSPSAYALAVVHPCCGNIGGGGFATLVLADGTKTFLDFREKAPGAATPTMYLDAEGNVIEGLSLRGYKAVGVPGTVLGLDTLLARYGTLPRAMVMAPAIDLAEDGFVLSDGDAAILALGADAFAEQPNVAAIFLDHGKPWQAGDRLVQKDLAATLKRIAVDGPDAFYKGPVAAAVVAASRANGGILAMKDFADYSVAEASPVTCDYRGYAIVSAPPPSSGGTIVCEILNILEGYPMADLGYQSAAGIHLMVEAMRHAFLDRNSALGDPAFVDNPVERLLSKDYAAAIRADDRPRQGDEIGRPPARGGAARGDQHDAFLDRRQGWQRRVADLYDQRLFRRQGDRRRHRLLPQRRDGRFRDQAGRRQHVRPRAGRPPTPSSPASGRSRSMSPTVVTKDGKPFLVVGAHGGPRIITIVVQTIINVIDHGMDIKEAVNAPRIHHQWLPDKVFVERRALSPDTAERLAAMGYTIEEQGNWGGAQAITVGGPPDDFEAPTVPDGEAEGAAGPGFLFGANDDRDEAGAAVGY